VGRLGAGVPVAVIADLVMKIQVSNPCATDDIVVGTRILTLEVPSVVYISIFYDIQFKLEEKLFVYGTFLRSLHER
jgi:hypothetical protein